MNTKLSETRKRAGITQEQLAKAIGSHKQTVCQWERGKRKIPLKYVSRIASFLVCSENDLIDSEGSLGADIENFRERAIKKCTEMDLPDDAMGKIINMLKALEQ